VTAREYTLTATQNGDIDLVRKAFADAHPAVKSALSKVTSCDRWQLAEMPELARWTSKHGHVALLGDSAHGMLPMAAQVMPSSLTKLKLLTRCRASRRYWRISVPSKP
jgi:salicylate hydroxylase